jgi:lipoprotein-anchoring transpeptidase ErfK/SrfK
VRTDPGKLQLSWVAVALAAALSATTPAAARLAGEHAGTGSRPAVGTVVATVGQVATGSLRPAAAPPAPSAATPNERSHPVGWVGAGGGIDGPGRVGRPQPALLVRARDGLVARRFPSASSRSLGRVATVSKYYRVPLVLWVEAVDESGRWGRIELPYVWPRADGWIPLRGLRREATWLRLEVDLSEHLVRVYRRGHRLFTVRGATGSPSSPTPPGDYMVTDRVPFARGSSLGSFAFGISGIQPRLPAGWTGGNQLAIHGTNQPWSIGRSASAGCVRVSERALERLKPLLRLGTPVVIHP